MNDRHRLGILLSGRGSNFIAIADAAAAGKIPAEISVVISDRADAPGLREARRRGFDVRHIPPQRLSREAYDRLLAAALKEKNAQLVCLAGFMRILSPFFIAQFPNRILNIHPSLLPAFPGKNAQKQALERGVKITGCTVHFVTEEVDAGPIILQAAVPVLDADTEENLSARILKEEHRIYPEAIRLVLAVLDGKRET